MLYLNVLARSINHALYPRMSKAWPYRMGEFGAFATARPAPSGARDAHRARLAAARSPHLRALYGSEFDRAVVTYQVLVLGHPIRMLGNTLSLASATDRQTRRTIAVTVTAVLNIA